MTTINLREGHRLNIWTEDDFAEIWEEEDRPQRLENFRSILTLCKEAGYISSIKESPGFLTLTIENYFALFPLMEIGALTLDDFIEQIAPDYPELQSAISDSSTITQIPYGVVIDGITYSLSIGIDHQHLIITP